MVNLIGIVILLVLIVLSSWYFLSKTEQSNPVIETRETTSTSALTTTITSDIANFLQRKFYINVSSGIGVTWFGNSTLRDVRNGFNAWQSATDNLIQFNEVNDSNADIIVGFTGELNKTPSTKTIGETFVRTGLIKGSIQIVPQGLPCRNTGILAHELGHIIGLEHNQTNRFDTMYPFQSFGCDQNISSYDAEEAKKLIEELIS